MIKFDRLKDGKKFAITFSFDDCNVADRRLISILNKYDLKGTFHLISGRFDHDTVVNKAEVKDLYSGHEIAGHTLDHPHVERLPGLYQAQQLLKDKENLEDICGYIVRGFSYPYNAKNEYTIPLLKSLGFAYSRTTKSTFGFQQPEDLYLWNPTCHYKEFDKVYDSFMRVRNQSWNYGGIFYIWGHSYEIADANGWEEFDNLCSKIAHLDDVWYATNIEIADYVNAQKSLLFSANTKKAYNPTCTDVWVSVDGKPVLIKGGETTIIE